MKLLKSLQEVSQSMQAQPGLLEVDIKTGCSKVDEELFRDQFEHLLCLGFCFPKVYQIHSQSLHLYSYVYGANKEISVEISSEHPRALFEWVVEKIVEKAVETSVEKVKEKGIEHAH